MKTQATSIVDSRIFGDMFRDAAMRQVWFCWPNTRKSTSMSRANSWRTFCNPMNNHRQAGVMVDRVLTSLS